MADWIVGITLVLLMGTAVLYLRKHKKKGKCCGGCSGCAMAGKCKDEKHEFDTLDKP